MEQHGEQQLRSLRDFLLLYNRMTELCFCRCVADLNYRLLSAREEQCLDSCAGKLVHANHRLMRAYVALMPALAQRRAAQHPAGPPGGQPDGQPAGQPSGQPDGQPAGQPARQPDGQPAGQPTGQQPGQPDGHQAAT